MQDTLSKRWTSFYPVYYVYQRCIFEQSIKFCSGCYSEYWDYFCHLILLSALTTQVRKGPGSNPECTLFPLSNTYFRFKVCHERRSNMAIIVLQTRTTVAYSGQYEKTCKQHDLLTRRIGKRLAQPELFNWRNNNCCLFISSNLQLRNIQPIKDKANSLKQTFIVLNKD